MSVSLRIKEKLTQHLQPIVLEILDESYLHAHHTAMKDKSASETHFKINIVSDSFKDKKNIERHRMVYSLLNQEFESGLHALSLSTKTIQENLIK